MAIEIKENILLAPYTMYKIGGGARYFTEVKNWEELQEARTFSFLKNLPVFVLGAGSNVLVSDKGFPGLVIRMAKGHAVVEGTRLLATAEVMMAYAASLAARSSLAGFEWAIGVPGTLGGSIRGNAGCFGGEMKDAVLSVRFMDGVGSPREFRARECEFSYRDSIFKRHPEWIIFSVTLDLEKGDREKIREKIAEISRERAAKQDIGTKSCGCMFKNVSWSRPGMDREKLLKKFPELSAFSEKPNIPASFLIDEAGLKGERVGRVAVSEKHANYFVNEGGASAENVVILAGIVRDAVRQKYGILLEEEIQYVGW
jgi:UDP-N-acetylmuramate dehydrogenase